MPADFVRYEVDTGSTAGMKTRVSALTRKNLVRAFKIGITCNPESRCLHYTAEYDEMVVIYRTSSDARVRALEAALVDHNWDHSDNLAPGGGGGRGRPPYFLYVVRRFL